MPIKWENLYDTSKIDGAPLMEYNGLSKRDLIERELELLESTPEGQELFTSLLEMQLQNASKSFTSLNRILITTSNSEHPGTFYHKKENRINISFEGLKKSGFVTDGNLYALDLGSAIAHESFHATLPLLFENTYINERLVLAAEKLDLKKKFGSLSSQEAKIMDRIANSEKKLVLTKQSGSASQINLAIIDLAKLITTLEEEHPEFIKKYMVFSDINNLRINYEENFAMDFVNSYRARRGFKIFREQNYRNSYYFETPLAHVVTSFDVQGNNGEQKQYKVPNGVSKLYKIYDDSWIEIFGLERDIAIRQTTQKIDTLIEGCEISEQSLMELKELFDCLEEFDVTCAVNQYSDNIDIRINGYFNLKEVPIKR